MSGLVTVGRTEDSRPNLVTFPHCGVATLLLLLAPLQIQSLPRALPHAASAAVSLWLWRLYACVILVTRNVVDVTSELS
jgi:hypothetical protein